MLLSATKTTSTSSSSCSSSLFLWPLEAWVKPGLILIIRVLAKDGLQDKDEKNQRRNKGVAVFSPFLLFLGL
ncbi:hypothetical protein MLD38_037535 [Melastoma candidum]|uniref:Uncharacterized protein n=1 Tax=Melastoma candidum TaxID=119954 RepID=A0ACB9LNS7_9MYRT|nr:hypothetical protein MLD38_037535 [Melastoma candidum]